MGKILIIDDDKDIAELVSLILRKEKIESDIITDSLEALKVLETANYNYDLILLDIMMPNISGTELCIKVRDKVSCPIVFLSAKKELVDKMVGYEIGGDDYITKPFDNTELILKIKSHLRLQTRNKVSKSTITIGEISINKESFEVYKNKEKIEVSTREFELLSYLMENAGIALSKELIKYPGYAEAVSRGWSMYLQDAFTLNIEDKVSNLVQNIAATPNAREGNITLLAPAYRNCYGEMKFC